MLCALRAWINDDPERKKNMVVLTASGKNLDSSQFKQQGKIVAAALKNVRRQKPPTKEKEEAVELYNTSTKNTTPENLKVVLLCHPAAMGQGVDFKRTSKIYWLSLPQTAVNFYQQFGRGVRYKSHDCRLQRLGFYAIAARNPMPKLKYAAMFARP